MTIRTRLTLFFAGLMLGLVVVVSGGVYFFERNSQRRLFEQRLLDKAEATAQVYVRRHDRLEPTDTLLLLTQQNQYEALYNEANERVYASRPYPGLVITPRFLRRVRAVGHVFFSHETAQGAALYARHGGERLVVLVTADDDAGRENLLRLRNNLLITNVLGLLLVVGLANLFAGRALEPVQQLSREIQGLSSRTLGQPGGALSTGNGRDELARLAAQFNALLARLADTVAQNRNFVWHASHELRTPLANLLGTLDISRAYDERPQELRATLASATEEVRHLIALTNDLLLLAELSQEKPAPDLPLGPVLLIEPLLDAVQTVQRRYPDTPIDLQLPAAVEESQAPAHAELLTLALVNLLDNACKYSPEGQPVRVALAPGPLGWEYVVRDAGLGIAPEALPHVFEPLYRAEAVRGRIQGNGVGLSLVRRVAELHGGGVAAQSGGVGAGTEFRLWLGAGANSTTSNQQLAKNPHPASCETLAAGATFAKPNQGCYPRRGVPARLFGEAALAPPNAGVAPGSPPLMSDKSPLLIRYEQALAWFDHYLIRPLYTARVRRLILQSFPFWIASLLTGVMAVGYEKVFNWAEQVSFTWLKAIPLQAFGFTPVAFLIAWALVYYLAPAARGSGIPQVMAGIDLSNPAQHRHTEYLLSLRVAAVKIISSVVLLLGGGVIGREGPTIQVSAAIFRAINRLQPAGWPQLSRQIALVTGGAAGLAAAFNTPLGGIVFVVEELTQIHLSRFRMAVFAAVIIAGLTAQQFLGPYLYLGFPKVTSPAGWFQVLAMGCALACGLAGALFAKALLAIGQYRRRFTTLGAQVGWVMGCGFALATLAYFAGGDGVGTGKPIINRLLFQNSGTTPFYLFPVRFAGMVLSYSGGGAGGVFATSLSAGALLGDGLARLAGVPVVDRNLLILVSMVGFLTGVVRSPFTAAILVLEMTDRHSAIFQLLLGALLAQGIAALVDPHSLYEHLKQGFIRESLGKDAVPHAAPPAPEEEEDLDDDHHDLDDHDRDHEPENVPPRRSQPAD